MDFVAKQSRLSTSKEKPTLSIKFDFYHETKVTQRSAGISIAVNFTLQHEDHYKVSLVYGFCLKLFQPDCRKNSFPTDVMATKPCC